MTNRVLFIDDEPNILNALRRMLRSKRASWQMYFSDRAQAGLEILDTEHHDLVVSDIKMPEMDGAEFLRQVRLKHPHTIRIALSGHSENETILRSIGPTHQFLAKPCDHRFLIETIERALSLRELVPNEEQRTMATALSTLKTPQSVYDELKEAVSQNATSEQVFEIIQSDLSLTSTLLKISSSAYFTSNSKPSENTSLAESFHRLGMDTIRELVTESTVFAPLQLETPASDQIEAISNQSIKIGKRAHAIAQNLDLSQCEKNIATSSGTLSQIGKYLTLTHKLETESKPESKSGSVPNCEYENLGAFLLGTWGTNPNIVDNVAFQNAPSRASDTSVSALTCLHLSLHFLTGSKLDVGYIESTGLTTNIQQIKEETEKYLDMPPEWATIPN